MAKQTQEEAQYTRGYPMRMCGTCTMFGGMKRGTGNGNCSLVMSSPSMPINTYGICNNWDPLENPWGNKLDGQSRHAMEQFYNDVRGGPGQ